jgi:ribosomal protein S11
MLFTKTFSVSEYLQSIKFKKQYINKLKVKAFQLQNVKEKSHKSLNVVLSAKTNNNITCENPTYFIHYIIAVTFSESNIFLHVTNFSGKLILFSSAGLLHYRGKRIQRYVVFKDLMKKLVSRCKKAFKNEPVFLYLKNPGHLWFLVPKFLKQHFFIRAVRICYEYPFNGCRSRKKRRKKVRSRRSV